MPHLFAQGRLSDYLDKRLSAAIKHIHRIDEDDFLLEPVESLVERFAAETKSETLSVGTEWTDGEVKREQIDVSDDPRYANPWGRQIFADATRIIAVVSWSGNRDLFLFQPSRYVMIDIKGDIRDDTIAVSARAVGTPDADTARREIAQVLEPIHRMAAFARTDVEAFNSGVTSSLRSAIERRRQDILSHRELAGALGLPVRRRTDAPRRVPMERKTLGPRRREASAKEHRTTPTRSR